jgi:cardiolipin synthase A/B
VSLTAWQLLRAWWPLITLCGWLVALASVPSVLVNRRGQPQSALAWLLALVALPLFAVPLWWLLGRQHLERRRRKRRSATAIIAPRLEGLKNRLEPPPSQTTALLPLRHLPADLERSVFPATSHNAVSILPGGEEAFAAMERVIESATHHVHALFYIWKNDKTGRRFRDLLIDKAKAGVQVRVLVDAFGSPVMATQFARRLRKAGGRVARFLPPDLLSLPRMNFRNHRKILSVDGKVGIIGGFNIADEYRMRWRDMGLCIRGPAVDQLQEVFADDWYFATNEDLADPSYFGRWDGPCEDHDQHAACAVVASGPDERYGLIHDALFIAINKTEQRLYVATPYFIPSRAIAAALRAAAFRGVDVRIMLPGNRNDVPVVRFASRSYYPELLDVGVRIFEYQPSMLHSKTMVFDDKLAMIGSANLDSRSFRLNFEASCFVGGEDINRKLAQIFDRDAEKCHEVRLADLEGRAWPAKLAEATANLLSPLL